jgi:hypothetical protein
MAGFILVFSSRPRSPRNSFRNFNFNSRDLRRFRYVCFWHLADMSANAFQVCF